jgi:molybdopterin converting factor small subunit
MTIQVKLFGDLRKRDPKVEVIGGSSTIVTLDESHIERVSDILKKLNIEETEVSHIFVNGKYSGPRKKVQNSDIVSLFPKNMGLLYKWYFHRDEDE